MANYTKFGQTMTAYILSAIDHMDENTDPDVILELMDRTNIFVKMGTITPEQFEQVNRALMTATGKLIPDDYETDAPYTIESLASDISEQNATIQSISDEVDIHDNAIGEIGELVASIIDGE